MLTLKPPWQLGFNNGPKPLPWLGSVVLRKDW